MPEFEVTHFFVTAPSLKRRLKPVKFLCRMFDQTGHPQIVEGTNPAAKLSDAEIASMESNGEICRVLPSPRKSPDLGVFLGKTGHIYLASKSAPLTDPSRLVIGRLPSGFLKKLGLSEISVNLSSELLGRSPAGQIAFICDIIKQGWGGNSQIVDQIHLALLEIVSDLEREKNLLWEAERRSLGVADSDTEVDRLTKGSSNAYQP